MLRPMFITVHPCLYARPNNHRSTLVILQTYSTHTQNTPNGRVRRYYDAVYRSVLVLVDTALPALLVEYS